MHNLFLQNNVFERLEATEVEMEQPYWAGIHDSLADGIQFVENHVGLTESIKGSLQCLAKKKARYEYLFPNLIHVLLHHHQVLILLLLQQLVRAWCLIHHHDLLRLLLQ